MAQKGFSETFEVLVILAIVAVVVLVALSAVFISLKRGSSGNDVNVLTPTVIDEDSNLVGDASSGIVEGTNEMEIPSKKQKNPG